MADDTTGQDEVRWMVSGWDHKVHAFRTLADVSAEAACTHVAMTSRLTAPTGAESLCPACAVLRSEQLGQLVRHDHERGLWT